jgi:hypothetical protein
MLVLGTVKIGFFTFDSEMNSLTGFFTPFLELSVTQV